MNELIVYTSLWILCLVVAVIASALLARYLRQVYRHQETILAKNATPEEERTSPPNEEQQPTSRLPAWCSTKLKNLPTWWRYALPAFVALVLTWFNMDVTSLTVAGQALWIVALGLLIPLVVIYATLLTRTSMMPASVSALPQPKNVFVVVVLALLLLMNAAFLASGLAFAKRRQLVNYNGQGWLMQSYVKNEDDNSMVVELEWSCGDNDSCNDEQVLYCQNTGVSPSNVELRTTHDYDMTLYYSSGTVVDQTNCPNGDWWWEAAAEAAANGDDDAEGGEEEFEGYYMDIVGDCYTCQLDQHSGGNMFQAKWRFLVLPLWVLAAIMSFVAIMMLMRTTSPDSNSASTQQLLDETSPAATTKAGEMS